MKKANFTHYCITIMAVLILSLGGCKFKNKTPIHDSDSLIIDDRIVGVWSIGRYQTLPYKTFVVTKENGQYLLVESEDLQLDGSNSIVGQCYYKNLKKKKLKIWLFKINNLTYVEVEDKTCNKNDSHSYALYKITINDDELFITSTNSGWLDGSVKNESKFKKYLKGKTFDDIFNFPRNVAINLLQKHGDEVFDVGEETKTAVRLPDDINAVKAAAAQFREMAPKLGKHISQHRARYEKVNGGNSVNEYSCYGEAALLYKVAYLLGDEGSREEQVKAMYKYVTKIEPFLTNDKELNLYRCKSIISAYESYQNNMNVAIGAGIAIGAMKKIYDWVSTPTLESSNDGNTSSYSSGSDSYCSSNEKCYDIIKRSGGETTIMCKGYRSGTERTIKYDPSNGKYYTPGVLVRNYEHSFMKLANFTCGVY